MRYLVTGGCGFIGSNYIRQLLSNEKDCVSAVVNVDKLTYAGRRENLADIEKDPRYKFVRLDVADSFINVVMREEQPDIVVHFAAESHVDRSIINASEFIRTNVLGTYWVLQSALSCGSVKRYVQVGSVTGDTPVCVKDLKSGDISLVRIDALDNQAIQQYETLVLNSKHEVVFAPVKYHISHSADCLYRIKYTGGEVSTTGNHSVFVFDKSGNIVQKRADQLQQDEKLVTFVGDIDCGKRTSTIDFREVMKTYDTKQVRVFLEKARKVLEDLPKSNITKEYSHTVVRRLKSLGYVQKSRKTWRRTSRAETDLSKGLEELRWQWIKTKLRIPKDEITVTSDIARAIGLYIAEGHREHTESCIERYTNGVTWTINEQETHKIRWIKALASSVGASCRVFDRPKDHCQQVSITNRVIHAFFEQFGSTAYTKKIPPFIWSLQPDIIRCVLEGYEGDAHIKTTKARSYTSVNVNLLTELAWLCRLNNIDSNICLYTIKDNQPPYCKKAFDGHYGQLAIASNNYKKQKGLRHPYARCLPKEYVLQRIGKKEGRLYDHTDSLSRTALSRLKQDTSSLPQNIGFAKVTNVEIIESPSTIVYDLSVPENHTFFGGRVPVLLHNTDEVYGQIPMPDSSVESDPLDPRSPYSSSKASGDLLALSYYTTHGLPVTVTRCSNNYGPYQFPEKLIPLFVTNLIDGLKVPVYGDGKQIREWIHVLDHCRAIDFVIKNGQPGEIYNIGSGIEMENIEITKLLLKEIGRDESFIKYVTDRKGHDRRYSINSSKLRSMGWYPEYDFETGIAETVRWYRNNEDWWRPLK